MLYSSLAAVPESTRHYGGVFVTTAGVWATPQNRMVDGAAILPFGRAATLQGNGTTQAPPQAAGIATAVTKSGNLVELAVLSSHAETAGAMRSQVNYTDRAFAFGQRYAISTAIKLDATWDFTGTDTLILQCKDREDTALGETGRNPPAAIYLLGDRLALSTRTDTKALSSGASIAPNATIYAPVSVNTWTTVTMVVEFGRGFSGFAEFWVDRTLVGRSDLPVGYNDERGPTSNYALYCYQGLGALSERRALSKGLMAYRGSFSVAEICEAFDSHPNA